MEIYCSNNALPNMFCIYSLLHLHSTRMAQLFVIFSLHLPIPNHIFIYFTSPHIFPNYLHLFFLRPTILLSFRLSSSYTVCIDNLYKYIIVCKPMLVNSSSCIKSSTLIIILSRYFRIFFRLGMLNWQCHGMYFQLLPVQGGGFILIFSILFFITETITWTVIYILTFSSRLDAFRTVPRISVRCLRLDFPTQRTSIFFDLCAPNKSRTFCCRTHGKTTTSVLKGTKTIKHCKQKCQVLQQSNMVRGRPITASVTTRGVYSSSSRWTIRAEIHRQLTSFILLRKQINHRESSVDAGSGFPCKRWRFWRLPRPLLANVLIRLGRFQQECC